MAKVTKPVSPEAILKDEHIPEVEDSVKVFQAAHPDATSQELGFIRKNKIKGKTCSEIEAILERAVRLSGGHLLGYGDQFKIWCERFGRVPPSDALVAAMNADPGRTSLLVVEVLQESPTIYRSYCTYLSGRTK